MLSLAFLIAALVCYLLAAFGYPPSRVSGLWSPLSLIALGLACQVAAAVLSTRI